MRATNQKDVLRLGDKFERSVSMLAWGFNEEKLIEQFLVSSLGLLENTVSDFELLFVDDGSTDRTPDIVAEFARTEPRLRMISYKPNKGIGHAAKAAIAGAGKEFLFWQTVDWAYDLKNLRIFLELLKHFTIVKTVRPVPERLLSHIPVVRSMYRIRSRSDTLRKAVISLTNYYLLRLLYGLPFHDFQGIYFCPTRLLQSMVLESNSSFLGPEILFKSYVQDATFIEVPVQFIPRERGSAKGTKLRALTQSFLDVVGNTLRFRKMMRSQSQDKRSPTICRVSEPVFLDDYVLHLIVPLFKEFR